MRLFNLLMLLLGLALGLVFIGQNVGAVCVLLLCILLAREVRVQTKHALGALINAQQTGNQETDVAAIFMQGMQAKAKGLEFIVPEGEDKHAPRKIYIGTKPQNLWGKSEFVPQAYIDERGYHAVQYHDE